METQRLKRILMVTMHLLWVTWLCAQKPQPKPDTAYAWKNTPVSFNVLSNDTDPDGDAVVLTRFVVKSSSYTISANSTKAITVTGVGALLVSSNGFITFMPAAEYTGSMDYTYTANDGKVGDGKTAKINIVTRAQPVSGNFSFTGDFHYIEVLKDSCSTDQHAAYYAKYTKETYTNNNIIQVVTVQGWVQNCTWNDKDSYYLFHEGTRGTQVVELTERDYFLIAMYGCKR